MKNERIPEKEIEACIHVMAQYGATVENHMFVNYPTNEIRFRVWMAEAIVYADRELGRGTCSWAIVLRTFAQANEYKGRTNNTTGPALIDALSSLAGILERRVSRVR